MIKNHEGNQGTPNQRCKRSDEIPLKLVLEDTGEKLDSTLKIGQKNPSTLKISQTPSTQKVVILEVKLAVI